MMTNCKTSGRDAAMLLGGLTPFGARAVFVPLFVSTIAASSFVCLMAKDTTSMYPNFIANRYAVHSNEDEQPTCQFKLPQDEWPQCVGCTPDGSKVLAGAIAGNLWVWDLKKKETDPKKITLTTGELLTGSAICMAVSSDNNSVMVGCADRNVRLIDLKSGKVTHVLKKHRSPVFSLTFSKDNCYGFSGSSGESKIIQWDLKQANAVQTYDAKDWVKALAVAPNGKTFLSAELSTIQEWDVDSGKRLRTFAGHKYRIYGLFYSPDGKTIISGSTESICVWDAESGKNIRTFGHERTISEHFALSSDGRRVLKGGLREAQLFDVKTGEEIKRWEKLKGSIRVGFSADGRYALMGADEGLSLWVLPESK